MITEPAVWCLCQSLSYTELRMACKVLGHSTQLLIINNDVGPLSGSLWAHEADRNDDDENDSHRSANECNQLADLGPAEVSLFTPE